LIAEQLSLRKTLRGFFRAKLLGRLRARYEAMMLPVGRRVGSSGVNPNAITTFSLLVSCGAGLAFALKLPIIGALSILLSAIVDMLDGAVARAMGKSTRFGAVYDHVLDRYAEFAVLVGIGFGGMVDWPWVIFCLFGMVMASFVRAKAESVGGLKACTVGIAERQEKLILLMVGAILEPVFSLSLLFCVVIVGVLSQITVVQRLFYTFDKTRGLKFEV
jgi:CDP-diacylglycerol--glycerol-3-phosphate 3-phosphatidyltransferase/archaetidylinositol phosphate synthase